MVDQCARVSQPINSTIDGTIKENDLSHKLTKPNYVNMLAVIWRTDWNHCGHPAKVLQSRVLQVVYSEFSDFIVFT